MAVGSNPQGCITIEAKFESLADHRAVRQGLRSLDEVRTITIHDAVVDMNAMLPSLPTVMIQQLGLERSSTARLRGSKGAAEVPMYDAVRLTILDRQCTTDVLGLPDGHSAAIGRTPLGCLDLVVDPQQQTLIGNPAHGGERLLGM